MKYKENISFTFLDFRKQMRIEKINFTAVYYFDKSGKSVN